MAQNIEKTKQIFSDNDLQATFGEPANGVTSDIQTKKPIFTLAKSNPKDKITKSRFERFTPQRASKSLATHPLAENSSQASSQKYQPSRLFAQKCLTELQAILELTKVDYHEEIKRLFTGQDSHLYTDLNISIGEDFERSLHKCVLAARAYKFYSAIKLFKKQEEDHIIISQFQELKTDDDNELSSEDRIAEDLKRRQQREALEFHHCILPEGLIAPELILNFLRRAYFDVDLIDEETQLTRRLINWLKENRPELVQAGNTKVTKIQPDYRESFRTIQPDIENLSRSERTSSPATTDISTADSAIDGTPSKMTSQQETFDETSQAASLTRTETFEKISKTDNNSSVGSPAPTAVGSTISTADNFTDDEESRKQVADESESPESYAPTTRTGLKPKKFTTPQGLKSTPRNKPSGATNISIGTDNSLTSRSSPFARSGSIGKSMPITRSSGKDVVPGSSVSMTKPKTSTPISKTTTKPTIITRAHPISMERSQSPASVAAAMARGKPKNFIAANKKLLSQMEKRVVTGIANASSSQCDQTADSKPAGTYESENEASDASYFALEPLTSDNLASQLDKFTLVSYSKLADALSRMLIGEILTDATVLVNGGNKQISAHRCILAARSAYLNDVINQCNLPLTTADSMASKPLEPLKIDLGEFSYQVVYFAIMHIYSGIVKVPDDLELEELAKLSHLLHVGTLRQVCIHNLRMNYCHYFHKPCSVCCIGVLKTLPLAWRYDYTELYSKCLQWIGSHFAQIFCLEEFSNLKPHDLIEECYKETLNQLMPDNIIQKTIECQKLLKSLPRVKWTEGIICLVGRQLEDFCHYVADNCEKVLQSDSFLALGKSCWECEVLEENLLAAMNHLKPDSGCKTLIQLDKIECSIEPMSGGFSNDEDGSSSKNVSESFANLVGKMRKYCERFLLREAAAVVHCPSWKHMHPSLQRRIKDQALLSTDFDEPTKNLASKPRLQSMARQQASRLSPSSPQPRLSGGVSPINKPLNDQSTRVKSPNNTYLPTPKNKPTAARHVKVLK